MAETIEAFVAKLQAEGVQAGQRAAEQLQAEARRKADEIVRQAEAKARQIVAEGEARREATLAKSRTELQLAARDTVLRLRDALSRAMQAVLSRRTGEVLKDVEFLRRLVHDVVMLYVQSDIEHKGTVKINVPPEMKEQFAHWLLEELVHKTNGQSFDLKGTLAEAGFEYEVDGATVEVTQRSVVEALSDLAGSALREVLDEAVQEDKP
jgi:vacuolar-type H+-ATPase subunit E/Vma4